ncbi:transporter substrate-binding domain-containing diguanylate cyclase [Halarcobacter bivalviorum]|uniref:transporter substrate-binding domain-containing diguanylate cyclase n=1 Tax=Halarcobacter bivalviorum TaxID=663364 RepID=UPI00100AF06A|nr:transporter substrate-binding domain-containing protein [Halarcobacter bivalviorum]RXK06660.1 diguanylate cyclase [Halarcobacter bivalviorum]
MKRLLLILFLFILSIQLNAKTIPLTEEEQDFIKNNPVVKVGIMPDFTPFSYYIKNTPVGFEHELLNILSQRTGLVFEKKIDKWTTIYTAFKNKEVDVITSISYKKFREPFTTFTSSYYDIPIMIFVRDDFGEYKGIKSLEGKKVGVLKDVFYIKELEKMGTIDLVYYDTYEELTKDLVFGKIDALMQNLTNINFLIKKNLYSNLKLASELILPNTKKEDLRLGIIPEKPLLSSILQKGLNSITKKEKEELVTKWIGSIKEYKGGHIELDKDEKAYLNTKLIKYCINPDGLPFEGLNEEKEHSGISSDYYSLFEKILSAKFELVKTKNWNESITFIKEGKCDMLALGMETYERKKYLNFTSSYLDVPLVVATKVDVPFINHILDLEGEKVGIIKGDAFVKILRQKYPSLDLVEVENINEGLDKVKKGELFGFIDTLASIGYEFQQRYFGELKIAGKISETLKLSMAVVKDDTTLLNILQKAINSMTNELHREIFHKWIPIKYEKGVNYDLVWKIAISSLIVILLVIYWNRKIIKTNKLLEEAQKKIEEKNKELEKLATTDKLTNLYNRRKIEELLEIEINRSERFGHCFGLAIVDIDKFKEVNDTHGHQTGDKVLEEVANILNTNRRKTDFVGRYGGEEFVIICPESSLEGVLKLMKTFKEKISTYEFYKVKNKTASFGVTISQKDDTIESILKRADEALYKAKENGRNKIEYK